LPLKAIDLLQSKGEMWCRVALAPEDRDTKQVSPKIIESPGFKKVFSRVRIGGSDDIWYETDTVNVGRAINQGIAQLADLLVAKGSLRFSTIITSTGYRYYLSAARKSLYLHPLSAIYAAMFYLGSVTRYKPEDFDKILSGGYSWIVEEFIATAPTQFLHILSSQLAETVVVRPYAALV
jgi:YaaC-like Protein